MQVEVDPCVAVDSASFQRQLAIELEAAAQARHLVRAQNRLRIALGCVDDQVSVAITDSFARRTWRRKVELQGVDARTQTRLLALSVAELLLASRLELHMDAMQPTRREARRHAQPSERAREVGPAPVPDQAPLQSERLEDTDEAAGPDSAIAPQPYLPAPSTSPPRAASGQDEKASPRPGAGESEHEYEHEHEHEHEQEPEPSEPERVLPVPFLQLGAAGNVLAFSSSFTLLPGGELHVGVPLSASWALRGAAQAGHGRLQGSVSTSRGQLDSPVRITTGSLALSLHALTRTGNLELSLGAGVRVGLARLVGEPTDVQQESVRSYAPWAGPLLSPTLRYRFSAVVPASVSFEAGLMAVRVRALGPRNTLVTELHGLWMLLSLGLDLAFLP